MTTPSAFPLQTYQSERDGHVSSTSPASSETGAGAAKRRAWLARSRAQGPSARLWAQGTASKSLRKGLATGRELSRVGN